jgi:hypothetical protein
MLLRLRAAMQQHLALKESMSEDEESEEEMVVKNTSDIKDTNHSTTQILKKKNKKKHQDPQPFSAPEFVQELEALHNLQQDKSEDDEDDEENHVRPSPIQKSLAFLKDEDKNNLILYLFEQNQLLQIQRREVASLGEKLAADLVHHNHELRFKLQEEKKKSKQKIHEAMYHNPEMVYLQKKIDQLEQVKREQDKKLQFAVSGDRKAY